MTTASLALIAEALAGQLSPVLHCSWTRAQLRAVLLHYGATFLYMRAGQGYHIRSRHVGVGVYDVWLTPAREA